MSDKKSTDKPVKPQIKPTTGKLYENSKKIPQPKSESNQKKDK